jgi:hypothetical protein
MSTGHLLSIASDVCEVRVSRQLTSSPEVRDGHNSKTCIEDRLAAGVLALASMAVLATSCSGGDDNKGVDVDPAGARRMLYVGSEGAITWYTLDQSSGALARTGSLDVGYTASFLARSKDNRVLYALLRTVNEMQRQMVQMLPLEGFVATFSIDQSTGGLRRSGGCPAMAIGPPTSSSTRPENTRWCQQLWATWWAIPSPCSPSRATARWASRSRS